MIYICSLTHHVHRMQTSFNSLHKISHVNVLNVSTNQCTRIKYASSHIIKHQHVSITYTIITRIALQEY